jgi:hypothetical protein
MTVGAADLALADLGANGVEVPASTRHRSDVAEFVPCHVVELEDHWVILATVDARVGQQVLQDVRLGSRDRLQFSGAALCVFLRRSPVVRLVVLAAAVWTVSARERGTILTAARTRLRRHCRDHNVRPRHSAPRRARTYDLWIKSPQLYHLS